MLSLLSNPGCGDFLIVFLSTSSTCFFSVFELLHRRQLNSEWIIDFSTILWEDSEAEIAVEPLEEFAKEPCKELDKEDNGMGKTEPAAVKIFELTDIVEVGLPLYELLERSTKTSPLDEPVAVTEVVASTTSEVFRDKSEMNNKVDFDLDLDLDDFDEVYRPAKFELDDPVLAELKSSGLQAKVEEDNPIDDEPNEINELNEFIDFDDFLDEVAVVSEEPVGNNSPEIPLSEEPDVELPEDYLVDDELLAEDLSFEPEPELQPEAQTEPESGFSSSAPPPWVDPSSSPVEPHVFAEPHAFDFSQQIEDMTQEWSKQLLQTTYTSMDKMIKAIGDLAPTIIDQVAREVIPPLAEKVIKAEIARLEEKLELETGEEET